MADAYGQLIELVREIGQLETISALLQWDQETGMPPKATPVRAEQIALLAGLVHERRTSPAIEDLLAKLSDDDDDFVRATNIRETRRLYERATKIPTALVKEISHATTMAHDAWRTARATNHFAGFAPWLEKLIDLKRQVADLLGYSDEPYDALLDEFEPGVLTAEIVPLFDGLRAFLAPLVKEIVDSPRQPDASILTRHYPIDRQRDFSRLVAEAIGYDFEAGRLDVSVHPFSTGMTPLDVRITTRFDERLLATSLFGTVHEVGHALYEQGLNADHVFTPMAQAVSLGIHESQSRTWENLVGRSRPFWEYFLPIAKEHFADALDGVTVDAFYAAVNAVTPSLIRVEADEVTYNLHIMLRFDLERRMLRGELATHDVPEAWNAMCQEFLGLTPPTDADGCLQDIHWSMGVFGYFPTYALGNLYAAQFFDAARAAAPDMDDAIRRGEFRPLLDWLRANIHTHGQRYRANELVERVTGKPLSADAFVAYVRRKFTPLYGL